MIDATRNPPRGAFGAAAELEALLYDWHNDHRLRTQRDDVAYWIELTTDADRPLVLGAGTGRVAVPLARHRARTTVALDLSAARLGRIPTTAGLVTVCGDMRRLPLRSRFDTVVVPYSTLQLLRGCEDREQALTEAACVLAPGGLLHIDVSGNFDTREPTDWHVALCEPCPAVGSRVVEWERCSLQPDHALIEKSFRTEDDDVLVAFEERWMFLGALDLEATLERAGFDVVGVDRGYGHDRSPHRLVYHARRRD